MFTVVLLCKDESDWEEKRGGARAAGPPYCHCVVRRFHQSVERLISHRFLTGFAAI
jgi:hypothetical protein